jgi:hypothetical protein
MDQLLTPNQVAEMLKVSVRTVYGNSRRLGGFYPAGIKVLRFREEVIRGIMEGPGNREMEILLPERRQDIRRGRVRKQGRGQDGQGRPSEAGRFGDRNGKDGDPDDPYGLLALSRSLPATKRTTACPEDI